MHPFVFHNPTAILFGQGQIAALADRVPTGAPVLLLYGGGSIHRNGVHAQVTAALTRHRVVEFGGIEPNPLFETCMQAVAVVRREGIGFILAVGGGSVLDAAKFIAAAALDDSADPWRILRTHGTEVARALPIGTVLTLPATGSESNGSSVISRKETGEKLHFTSDHVFPVFSILDPTTTYSLPAKQVRNGIVDAFAHVMEQYGAKAGESALQDRLAESVLQTLVEVGPKALATPQDYPVRADLMWSATIALNTLLGCGVTQDWATHMIGHELTAIYGLDHAETLAVVMPGVWRHALATKRPKLAQFGRRVWGVEGAEAAIEATEAFFLSLGMPVRLSAYGIDAADAGRQVQERLQARNGVFGENGNIDGAAAAAIVRSRG